MTVRLILAIVLTGAVVVAWYLHSTFALLAIAALGVPATIVLARREQARSVRGDRQDRAEP